MQTYIHPPDTCLLTLSVPETGSKFAQLSARKLVLTGDKKY